MLLDKLLVACFSVQRLVLDFLGSSIEETVVDWESEQLAKVRRAEKAVDMFLYALEEAIQTLEQVVEPPAIPG